MTHKQRARWAAVFIAAAFGCGSPGLEQEVEVRRNWAIAIHGGAGHFGEEDLTVEQQAAYTASLSAALAAGERVLQQGGTSVEAVETVIRLMEDDSLFNAGRGAVFTAEGIQELDASIADGFTRNCRSRNSRLPAPYIGCPVCHGFERTRVFQRSRCGSVCCRRAMSWL